MTALALTGATVYVDPQSDPLRNATVLIEDSTIVAVGTAVAIPKTRTALDCSGCTIVAGFWNSHVHFFERMWDNATTIPGDELEVQLRRFSRYGFTTVFDLSSAFENTDALRSRIESGEICGPRILTTGEGIVPPGFSLPDVAYAMLGQVKTPLPEAADTAAATRVVRDLLKKKVDAIKLFASIPTGASLSADTMRSVVREAHQAGKPVFVHPNTAEDVERAAAVEVDIIAHTTPRAGEWSEKLLQRMHAANVAVTPTLSVWQHFLRHDRVSLAAQQALNAIGQLRAWHEHDGTVLFGTDLGAVDPNPLSEYALMRRAGLGFRDILASLTTAPALKFGAANVGVVRPGYRADLVVLDGDPAANLRSLGMIHHTLRAGKIIYSAT